MLTSRALLIGLDVVHNYMYKYVNIYQVYGMFLGGYQFIVFLQYSGLLIDYIYDMYAYVPCVNVVWCCIV